MHSKKLVTHTGKAEGEIFSASADTAMSKGICCSEVNYQLEHAVLELEKQAGETSKSILDFESIQMKKIQPLPFRTPS